MNIKFATWNMAHWSHKEHDKEAWNYFVNNIDCDVLLFQESYPNLEILNSSQVVWNAIGGTRPWGSGVYSSKYGIREFSFKTNFFGAITAVEITIKNDLKLIVISLYGLMEKISNVVYSIPNLHRMLSDLTDILESRGTKHRMRPLHESHFTLMLR